MKRLHAFLCVFLLLLQTPSAFSQCSADILISTDSIGNYVFSTDATNDSTAQYYWLLNNDTLSADSNQLQVTANLDSNGTYQICLYILDTASQCSFDTCTVFIETNAEYHPLLDSINIWHMFENGCPVKMEWGIRSISHQCSCPMYFTGNDTIMNGIIYKNLQSTWYNPLQGFIREDVLHRKVYFQYYDDTTETVLYDFSMEVGDTLHLTFLYESWATGLYQVDSMKSFSISSVNRRVLFLNQTTGVYPKMVIWIEGIGSLENPIYPFFYREGGCSYLQCATGYNPNPDYNASFVNCFEHTQSVYFDSCAYENALADFCISVEDPCNYYNICGAIEEIPSLASFSVAPNPAWSVFSFTLDVKSNDAFVVSIISIEGKTLKEIDLGEINAGLYSKEISIADCASGIYLIQCKAASGTLYRKLIVQK